jgi:hypothetical protein
MAETQDPRPDGLYWIKLDTKPDHLWIGAQWSNYFQTWFGTLMTSDKSDSTINPADVIEVSPRIPEPIQ